MTNITARNLNQFAVYWGAPQNDGYGGFTWGEAQEISCRWEEGEKVLLTLKGEEAVSIAEVFLGQDVEENGMLWLGMIDDLDSDELLDPIAAGAHRVLRFDKLPTLKGDYFLRKAWL